MNAMVAERYGLDVKSISRIPSGVGGQTYLVEATGGNYILKGVGSKDSYVRNEPDIAAFLGQNGIPTAPYIRDSEGDFFWLRGGVLYFLQGFAEGEAIPFHAAPEWFMDESARMLGRIHSVLSEFRRLPTGMGEGFLGFMLSEHPGRSYKRTRKQAVSLGDSDILADVDYRLSILGDLKKLSFDLSKFTCRNTHGDYKISQIICKDHRISAVIDWSSACVHPVCWEIIRSFTYADPNCKKGEVNVESLLRYVTAYLQQSSLNEYDLKMMPYFFYHQLLACDYYGQYYASSDENREEFLFQARLATRLIKWFESNVEYLSEILASILRESNT